MKRVLSVLMMTASAVTASEPLELEVRDDRVWMEASSAPRADALNALADAAGFELKMNAEFSEPITVRMQGVPLAVAIQRLTRPHSSVLMHEDSETGNRRIARVLVYRHTKGEPAPIARRRALPTPRGRPTVSSVPANPQRLEELSNILHTSEDVRAQRQAITELRSIGGESAVMALTPALASPDKGIRSYTVAILGQIGSQSAVTLLGQVATEDDDPDVRIRAVIALARQHGEQARQAVEAAIDDPDRRVREAAQSRLDAW